MLQSLKEKLLAFHKKYESRLDVLFFIGGFIFDALMVSEVDDLFSLFQQAVYLAVIALLLQYEILFRLHRWRPQFRWLEKVWQVRNLILHFLLGTLLNIYSLFYIKSASFMGSLVFLAIMVGLIVANESNLIKKANVSLKIGLFAICIFSYFSILYPLILGFIGWTPFLLSVLTTGLIFYLQWSFLKRHLPEERTLLRIIFLPAASVLGIFAFFYVMGWIPPVPLSVREQGVYHFLEKKEGHYLLSWQKTWWKFWQSSDEDFRAQPQDKIYYYTQIYSPSRFSDQVFVHWSWKDPLHGWKSMDRIPLAISGGRKEGFRGYAVKANFQEGDWQVRVETSLGHEISRLDFTVHLEPAGTSREFVVISR